MFKGIPYFCVLFLWNVHPLYLLQDKLRILGGGSTTNHLPSCLGGAVGITNGHNHADQLHHLGYQMILNPIITTTSPLVLELHPQVILFFFFWCVRLLFFFFFRKYVLTPDYTIRYVTIIPYCVQCFEVQHMINFWLWWLAFFSLSIQSFLQYVDANPKRVPCIIHRHLQ